MATQLNDKQRQAIRQLPGYKAFVESGTEHRVAKLIAMAYIIQSVANEYSEEAADLMAQYGLKHGKIKTTTENLSRSFDTFNNVLSSLIGNEEARLQLCDDYDQFKQFCDEFLEDGEESRQSSPTASEPTANLQRTHNEGE